MDNYTNYIAKQITGTTQEKIVFALLKEFIACNSLHVVYNMTETDMGKAFIEFRSLVNSLPETLQFVEFN